MERLSFVEHDVEFDKLGVGDALLYEGHWWTIKHLTPAVCADIERKDHSARIPWETPGLGRLERGNFSRIPGPLLEALRNLSSDPYR